MNASPRTVPIDLPWKRAGPPGIRWIEPFAFQPGKPFRVMPFGDYKRAGRVLDLTRERLAQIAENYAAGRPRWPIPIYQGHPTNERPDPPKVGEVTRLFVGEDGLYADPQWNEQGKALVESGAYTLNSPGLLWRLNGSAYTDEQGNEYDNVMDHLALTNRAYFSGNVVLFSTDPLPEGLSDGGEGMKGDMAAMMARMKQKLQEMLKMMGGEGEHGEQPDDHAAGDRPDTETLPDHGAGRKDEDKMTQQPNPETFSLTAEQFAELQAKAAKADVLEARVNDQQLSLEQMSADLVRERDTRRLDQIRGRVEDFNAIEEPALAEQLHKLEKADPDLFKYFDGLLAALDKRLVMGELFAQRADERPAAPAADTFEAALDKIHREEFKADPDKYGEAMSVAQKRHPALAAEYLGRPRQR